MSTVTPLVKYWIGIDPVPDAQAHKGLRDNGTLVYLAADVGQVFKPLLEKYIQYAQRWSTDLEEAQRLLDSLKGTP